MVFVSQAGWLVLTRAGLHFYQLPVPPDPPDIPPDPFNVKYVHVFGPCEGYLTSWSRYFFHYRFPFQDSVTMSHPPMKGMGFFSPHFLRATSAIRPV